MSNQPPPALVQSVQHNQFVVVADIDHRSEMIPDAIREQLPAMAKAGLKYLFIEVDPTEASVSKVIAVGGAFGRMVAAAQEHGITVVPIDDRSLTRTRDANYPVEAELFKKSGTYGASEEDLKMLVEQAPDRARMQEYIDMRKQPDEGIVHARNVRMVDNVAQVMSGNPYEKAMLVVGASHVNQRNDIDEMLRDRGFQTVTVQLKASDAAPAEGMFSAPDKSDLIIDAYSGEATASKNVETGRIHRIADPKAISWHNDEPVSDRTHPQMQCALDAAKGVNCSWNPATNPPPAELSPEKTGQMASPSTERRAADTEVGGQPR